MSNLPLTPDAVSEIVAIIDGSGYDRVDIKTDAFRLRLRREGGADNAAEGWTQDWSFAEAEAPAAADKVAPVEELPDGLLGIAAPLPGTFYRAPQPGAPAFVKEGDKVEKDTVVGIIETMKLMNPVHAGCTGTIEKVLVENSEMVDASATIMHVRPD
ncbi:acetyl-CoA carboxylase biotin carboxyl carrier protein [Altericroceibacterium endophyticum]|uniref:Biotin carboxyl carrier protein of acetyl-CoA carboxylase n=1 Tax=Altericroceibacterium endophyticum TaxID=1808508 RepID=A0A6I4T1R9_9SPHN|nr:biotin/lipoyl-containing protein [Altericroceibacterium endophyticum]MXO64818.1 acetyl-CoA carboxylase biotin carboxyl carrier protein subunit [Altericroceibacterium endophyticum]